LLALISPKPVILEPGSIPSIFIRVFYQLRKNKPIF